MKTKLIDLDACSLCLCGGNDAREAPSFILSLYPSMSHFSMECSPIFFGPWQRKRSCDNSMSLGSRREMHFSVARLGLLHMRLSLMTIPGTLLTMQVKFEADHG